MKIPYKIGHPIFCLVLGTVLAANAVANQTAKTLWDYEFKRTDIEGQVYYLDYRSPSERIEITAVPGVERDFAEQMISEKVFLFGSLFERQRVGYQGQHTEHIECRPEFKPVFSERELERGILKYFKGFANDRYAFGACDQESVAYSAVNAYFYCAPENTLYDLSYFSLTKSDQDTNRFIGGIRCP